MWPTRRWRYASYEGELEEMLMGLLEDEAREDFRPYLYGAGALRVGC